jgi:hypothetical protein
MKIINISESKYKINNNKKTRINFINKSYLERLNNLDKIRNVIKSFRSNNCVINMNKNDLDKSYINISHEISYTKDNDSRLYQLNAIRDIILTITSVPKNTVNLSNYDIIFKNDKLLLPGWILIKNNYSDRMFDFVESNRCNQHYIWKIIEGEFDESNMYIEFLINPLELECYKQGTIHNILLAIYDKDNEDWYIGRINQLKLEEIYPWEKYGNKIVRVSILLMKKYNKYIPPASILWCC